jgi:hypothetical protein
MAAGIEHGGLFAPNATTDVSYQGSGMLDLAQIIRPRPLASTAVGGDCYSLGYSVARGDRPVLPRVVGACSARKIRNRPEAEHWER